MIGVFHPSWQGWRIFGLDRIKPLDLDGMGVVTLGAHPPSLLGANFPGTSPLAVDSRSPVNIGLTVAIAAHLLWLVKAYLGTLAIHQLVTVSGAMAIETPQRPPSMLQLKGVLNDVLMHVKRSGFFILRKWHLFSVMAGCTIVRAHIEIHQVRFPGFYNCSGKIAIRCIIEFWHVTHGNRAVKGIAIPQYSTSLG